MKLNKDFGFLLEVFQFLNYSQVLISLKICIKNTQD